MARIVNGDIGFVFERHLVDQDGVDINLSGATTLQFKLLDSNGVLATLTAVESAGVGLGTDGLIRYVTVSGDIDLTGGWEFQFRVVGAGYDYQTEIEKFEVSKSLT